MRAFCEFFPSENCRANLNANKKYSDVGHFCIGSVHCHLVHFFSEAPSYENWIRRRCKLN